MQMPTTTEPLGRKLQSKARALASSRRMGSEPPLQGSGITGRAAGTASPTELVESSSERSSQQSWKTAGEMSVLRPGSRRSGVGYVTSESLRLPKQNENDITPSGSELLLPPRRMANHLIEVYWNYSHVIFPWLDKDEFQRAYDAFWEQRLGLKMNQRSFHCTLNLIFAISSALDPTAKASPQHRSANTYYLRARDLMHRDLLDVSHFQVLQNLLLAVQYLQSTSTSQQCLRTMSLATWMAQDLGLHLPQTTDSFADHDERELVRRVWHGCVMMDK